MAEQNLSNTIHKKNKQTLIKGITMFLAKILAVTIITQDGQIHHSEPPRNNSYTQRETAHTYTYQDPCKAMKEWEGDFNERMDRMDQYVDRNKPHHYYIKPDGRGGYDVYGN
jgi:hypothetical protein